MENCSLLLEFICARKLKLILSLNESICFPVLEQSAFHFFLNNFFYSNVWSICVQTISIKFKFKIKMFSVSRSSTWVHRRSVRLQLGIHHPLHHRVRHEAFLIRIQGTHYLYDAFFDANFMIKNLFFSVLHKLIRTNLCIEEYLSFDIR